MNLVTLNVMGTDEALLSLQKGLPIALDSCWRKGDARRNGALWDNSGFSATVVDAANPAELEDGLRAFIVQCASRKITFALPGIVEAQLSIGVTVGDSQQFIASIDLSPTLVEALADSRLALSFTAYPTSDEANAADAT